jgi:hypothetical protein
MTESTAQINALPSLEGVRTARKKLTGVITHPP